MKSFFTIILYGLTIIAVTSCTSSPKINTAVSSNLNELNNVKTTEDYRISTDDLLDVKVFQAEELSRQVRVDASGNITLPLLGAINVSGLTQAEAEYKLADQMSKNLLQNPQVSIFIKEFTTQRITIEGEVNKPGIYPINSKMTILQALAVAGGPSNLADMENVVLFRTNSNTDKAFLVNLKNVQTGHSKDFLLKNEDKIVIHRSDSRYWLKEASTLLSPLTILNGLAN